MSSRKHTLEPPENTRPSKRAETTYASSAGNVANNATVSDINKVDVVIRKHLRTYRFERGKFDELEPDQKIWVLSDIFRLIVVHSGRSGKLDPKLIEIIVEDKYVEQWETFAGDHPGLTDLLLECWSLEPPSFAKVLELASLQKPKSRPSTAKTFFTRPADYNATVSSWSEDFHGNSAKLLHGILRSYMKEKNLPYARYAAIVQSSGTGKSRMNDELAKTILYISLNLGVNNGNSMMYPPGEFIDFQTWFTNQGDSQETLQKRYEGFFVAIIIVVIRCLQEIQASDDKILNQAALGEEQDPKSATLERLSLLAKEFRTRMSVVRQSSKGKDSEPVIEYGEYRRNFYTDVMAEAKQFISRAVESVPQELPDNDPTTSSPTRRHVDKTESQETGDQSVAEAGKALHLFLDPLKVCEDEPLLVICFDEAHSLTNAIPGVSYTCFSELRRALRRVAGLSQLLLTPVISCY